MTDAGSGLSASDVLALVKDNDGGLNGTMGIFWIFALLMLNNGAFGGFGGNAGQIVTNTDLQASQNAQTNMLQLNGISDQISNNRYDTAMLLSQQTDSLMNQNNTNLINAIQGFNNLGLQITNQTNTLAGQISSLSSKLDECCCSIKTQMLQDRLDESERRNTVLQNSLDNANQSQYILSQMGRFVAWAGSGSQAATVAAG